MSYSVKCTHWDQQEIKLGIWQCKLCKLVIITNQGAD